MNKKLLHRIADLQKVAMRVEAEELLKEFADKRVIARTFSDRDADSLKQLALALVAHSGVVALLGSRDNETARLVFARSSDAAGDMNSLMRKACEIIEGRGGGKSELAQGGGPKTDKLQEAIESAVANLS